MRKINPPAFTTNFNHGEKPSYFSPLHEILFSGGDGYVYLVASEPLQKLDLSIYKGKICY